MRKFVFAALLGFTLCGCAPLQAVLDIAPKLTASVNNPVTKDMLNNVENGAIVAVAALGAYKKACVELAIPQSCRGTIQSIQVYTRKLEKILPELRAFVKNNDQVNAAIAYNTVTNLIADFKSEAGKANIPLGAN